MTSEDLIELSKQAAEVLGIPAKRFELNDEINEIDEFSVTYSSLWLVEDNKQCADIANSWMLNTFQYTDAVRVEHIDEFLDVCGQTAYLSDHQGNRDAAWRAAVLKTIVEQGKRLKGKEGE